MAHWPIFHVPLSLGKISGLWRSAWRAAPTSGPLLAAPVRTISSGMSRIITSCWTRNVYASPCYSSLIATRRPFSHAFLVCFRHSLLTVFCYCPLRFSAIGAPNLPASASDWDGC